MEKEFTEVYCGSGKGKTTLAVGQCLRASANGKSVIIIQFLKGKERRELDFLEELENQDIKIFRFEKMEKCYEQLNDQEKEEENNNILNELNFDSMHIILTGRVLPEGLRKYADSVTTLTTELLHCDKQ